MTKAKKSAKKSKISFKLKGEKELEEDIEESIHKIDDNNIDDISFLKIKVEKLEQTLQDKENIINSLQEEAREQLNLIKEIQKRARPPRPDDKVKVFEGISKLGKQKEDKVKEGQRTVAGILMGLSFHLYFTLYNVESFTIAALLLFSALCFFMSVVFTFIASETWRNFPAYLLITGAISLVINSIFMIYYRALIGKVTNISDFIFIYLMFPIVIGLIIIFYTIQETIKKRKSGFKKRMDEFFET